MVYYIRKKREYFVKRRDSFLLFFLALTSSILSFPALAIAMDKIAVLPFKIESPEPADNLKTDLQEMFSRYMDKMGFEAVNTKLINSILGDSISYSTPEKEIIPLGKANNADWIVMGEVTEKDGSIQLNVKVLDPDSAKIPFSIMMIVNDRKNIPESIKKIAESLGTQLKNNIIISEILIKGSKRASEDAILNIIESQKGNPFDQEKLDRDLRTIYKMGLFEDVYSDHSDGPEGRTITFNLVEKPTIIKITFEGNKYKKDNKLMEEIGIKKYAALDRNEIRQSRNRLLEFYRNDGYYNVEIEPQTKVLPDENEVILTYVIDEGEKVYITDIEFNGNIVIDNDDLKDIMFTKEKGWLTWFTDSGVLDRKKLEIDTHRLRAYYDSMGYIRAQIGDPEITYDEKEEGLKITIPVIEGSQYMVNDVIIEGDLLRPADELRRYINIKKGDPLSTQVILTEMDNITNFYADLGYAYAEALPSTRDIEGTNLVDIILKIQKNKRVRIERINISGNEKTKDKVIRRELKLSEGEYFSRKKLEKSRENIARTGLYEDNEIKTRKGSSDDLMVIDIDGKEQDRTTVSFSAGYGGYEKYVFMVEYANNNMFGRGQNIALSAMAGGTTTRFNITYREPWLFDKPVRGSITAYDSVMDYDEYTRERVGGGAGIAFLLGLDDYTRGTVNYTYDKSEITDIFSTSPYILSQAGETVVSSATFGIERNSKNVPWDTSKGSLNYLTFEYAGGLFGGDAAFNKYLFSSTFYMPVIWNTVLVVNTELGMIQGRSSGRLPLYEKFRLGGIDSVRGYEWGAISPLDPQTYDELGGNRKWLYKLEYRFPLAKGKGLTGLIFFDAGNAYDSDKSWKNGAGKSVGFGVRWFAPGLGPLRFEYGYKLKSSRNDPDNGMFEFRVGGSY